jgi:chromosome segregation ATPase
MYDYYTSVSLDDKGVQIIKQFYHNLEDEIKEKLGIPTTDKGKGSDLLERFLYAEEDKNCEKNKKMNKIDEKINQMLFEIESLKKENYDIRNSINNTRKNIEQVNLIKLNLNEKINEEKSKNDLLNNDLENYKNEFEKLNIDLNEEMLKKEKEDKIRKEKVQNKIKMVSDLQKKIEDFKNSRIKSKENF